MQLHLCVVLLDWHMHMGVAVVALAGRCRYTVYINLGPGRWASKTASWPKLLRK